MPHRQGRRHLGLPGRDYAAKGAYFVTMCTERRLDRFGEILNGEMRLNDAGSIVAATWQWLPTQYRHVTLDEWCVMPNHLHGILVLTTADAQDEATTAVTRTTTLGDGEAPAAIRKPLGRLIGAFKTVSTKQMNRLRNTPRRVLWQRNFWERVVRDDAEMERIRTYIRQNASASM